MRVLRLFSRLNIGGPSVHVILLNERLQARGYETQLVVGSESSSEGSLLEMAEGRGLRCLQMKELGREIAPFSDLRVLLKLYRLIRSYRPAVVHTHAAKAGLLGRLAAHLAGVPVVVHTYHGHVLRGYFGPAKTALFRRLEAALVLVSDALIAVSEAVKSDLVELGVASAAQIRVIPLGLEIEHLAGPLPRGRLRGESGVAPDAPLIGIVGRLVPIKDLPIFLRAAARVAAALPSARFAIVGDGEERARLESEAAALGLAGRVFFHGWQRDMAGVYGDLDVVVNCSLNEGTPVALIEALAAGRPVVATRVGGNPDLLGQGSRGMLVPPADPEALAQGILRLLEACDSNGERAAAARQYVLTHHSAERLVNDVDALYRELLAARGSAA